MIKRFITLFLIVALASLPARANLPGTIPFVGSSTSIAVTFVSQALNPLATCTTCTITGVDFGAGGHITASIIHVAGNGRTINTITLNGVAANIDVRAQAGNVNSNVIITSASAVPAGTGSIVITFNGSLTTPNFLHAIFITPPTLGTTATNSTAVTSLSMSMGTVSANSGVVAGYYSGTSSSTIDFNGGVTTDIRTNVSGTTPGGHGHLGNGTGASVTVTSTTVTSQTVLAAAAVFGP